MISLIDAEEVPGNLSQLQKDLTEAVAADVDVTDNVQAPASQPKVRTIEVNDDELPENLRGKDFKDVVRMLSDSQSTIGRMANDLGTQRKLTDRLLDLKRENDLHSNGAPAQKVQVNSSELLDNPTEAIERIVAARLAEQNQKTQAEIDALHQQRAAESFLSRHPDYQTVAASADFQQFVQATPYRQRVALTAAKGDWSSADELMSEYKDRQASRTVAAKTEKEVKEKNNLEAANKASLESGTSANKSSGGGKILRRVDLLKLQMEQPDVYYDEATQAVILKAYREGRVK